MLVLSLYPSSQLSPPLPFCIPQAWRNLRQIAGIKKKKKAEVSGSEKREEPTTFLFPGLTGSPSRTEMKEGNN